MKRNNLRIGLAAFVVALMVWSFVPTASAAEVSVFDPFTLQSLVASTQNAVHVASQSQITVTSVGSSQDETTQPTDLRTPAVRIPQRPSLRSPFRPLIPIY